MMSTRIKNCRIFTMGAMILALFVVSASALVAQQPVETTHDGKVVSVTGTQLVMSDIQSKEERSCALRSNVKVTLDGNVCKFSDLKPGMKIRVNLESDKPQAAAQVEAIDKNREFATL